ncbi:2TM domain-containing protein [Maribacter sp. 2304DJ31-5]|uniref:2TM domain-containing protein n=1 Tax=Maribacter sp. 2304DJ31-5 TaxID=3386273 RepID=UPI0039BCCBA8
MENTEEYKYKKAKEQVDNIKSFYDNLLAYVIVIPFLAYVDYNTTSFPWIIFLAIGWGIDLVCQWGNVHGYNLILGKDWEERKIREFMNSGKH